MVDEVVVVVLVEVMVAEMVVVVMVAEMVVVEMVVVMVAEMVAEMVVGVMEVERVEMVKMVVKGMQVVMGVETEVAVAFFQNIFPDDSMYSKMNNHFYLDYN